MSALNLIPRAILPSSTLSVPRHAQTQTKSVVVVEAHLNAATRWATWWQGKVTCFPAEKTAAEQDDRGMQKMCVGEQAIQLPRVYRQSHHNIVTVTNHDYHSATRPANLNLNVPSSWAAVTMNVIQLITMCPRYSNAICVPPPTAPCPNKKTPYYAASIEGFPNHVTSSS